MIFNGRALTKDERIKARRIPAGAIEVSVNAQRAAYYYVERNRHIGLCYIGSAARPDLHVSYRSVDAATAGIAQWLINVDAWNARKVERKQRAKTWRHSLKIGSILYTSWGYDQTNVDFYVVTRTTEKSVWIRKIVQDFESTGFMAGKCWPKMPIEMVGPETRHVVQGEGENDPGHITVDGHSAHLETGRDHYTSSYA